MPLPRYIAARRAADAQDMTDYQTVFARHSGAVAAPTASLHFDTPLLEAIRDRGVEFTFVTLHVGAGTFLPVKVEDVTRHRMHAEWGQVNAAAAAEIAATKSAGGRVIPVGTTALRLIETAGARRDNRTMGRRNGYFHLSRFPVPGHRCADDKLPPAEVDLDNAGLGTDGRRPNPADLRSRHPQRISLLFLWRCLSADPGMTG